MSKIGRSKDIILINKEKSILFWVLLIFIVVFMIVAPFYKALFNGGLWSFEGPIYWSLLWSTLALLVMSIYLYINRMSKENGTELAIIVWLIPLSYLISVINAASYQSAMNSVYIHAIYAIFFIIGLYLSKSKLGSTIIVNTLVISGYVLVLYGFLIWFGQVTIQDGIYGGRLSNVFQYPNSYSAFLIGMFFSSLLLTVLSEKRYISFVHAFMLVPIIFSFMLTSSRGALLVLPVVLIIYLLFLPITKQIQSLVCLVIATGISLGASNYLIGWGALILFSVLVSLLIIFSIKFFGKTIDKKMQNTRTVQLKNVVIPGCMAITALVGLLLLFGSKEFSGLFPEVIQQRIANFSSSDSSLLSRSGYYTDAIELIKDYPVFGAGGGAWSSMYQVYQSYAYTARQAHNFILQFVLETGIFGFAVLVTFLGYIIISFVRYFATQTRESFRYEQLVYFILMSSILIHSLLDFDMSFVYLGVIVFLSLGGMSSLAAQSISFISSPKWQMKRERIIPIFLAILSIFLLIASIRTVQGNQSYIATIKESQKSGDYDRMTEKLDKALKYQPHNPEYVLTKINLLKQAYQQTHDEKYIADAAARLERFAHLEPYNLRALNETYTIYQAQGKLNEVYHLVASLQNEMPWEISLYEMLIKIQAELGNWDQALNIYEEVNKKLDLIKEMPANQQYESFMFRITPQIALSAGQSYYMKENYEKAAVTLKLGRVSSDYSEELNKAITRWYLASLKRQQKEDKLLYDSLVQADPVEENKIQELLNL